MDSRLSAFDVWVAIEPRDFISRYVSKMRSSWFPRTQEACIDMSSSMTSGEEGPLDIMSPATIR